MVPREEQAGGHSTGKGRPVGAGRAGGGDRPAGGDPFDFSAVADASPSPTSLPRNKEQIMLDLVLKWTMYNNDLKRTHLLLILVCSLF